MSIVIRNIKKHKAVVEELKSSTIKIRKLETEAEAAEPLELEETKLEFQFLDNIIIDNERY